MSDKNAPGLAFMPFGNITHYTYRGSSDLIFEPKIARKSRLLCQIINFVCDFPRGLPHIKFLKGFWRSHIQSNQAPAKSANNIFNLQPVTYIDG